MPRGTTTTDDDREAREIKLVIDKCRAAMADLTPGLKAVVVQELHRWVVLEEASADPAHAPERRH